MKNRFLIALLVLSALSVYPVHQVLSRSVSSSDTGTLGADQWSVTTDGDLVPNANTYSIGTSSYYPAKICMGGVCKSSWGSVVSPMTDATDYTYTTDSGGVVRLYDAGYIALGAGTAIDVYLLFDTDDDDWYIGRDDTDNDFAIGVGSTLGSDERISIADDVNNTIITIGDNTNGYDHYLVFDGNATDQYLGYLDTYDMLIAGDGSTMDADMCWGVENASTPKLVLWNGIDGYGAIDLDYGSADITDHTFVSDGGTLVIDGTITLTSADVISNATDDTVRIASEDSATVLEIYTPGTSDEDVTLLFTADADADAGDRMAIVHDGGTNSMLFQSDTASADTLATILTLAKTGEITTTAAINSEIEDSANTSVTDVLNLQHFTSGTAAAGIGTGLTFDLENAAGTEEEHAYIDVVSAVATDGSEDTDLVIGVMAGGTVSEFLRIDTDNSATAGSQLVLTQTTTETDAILDILSLANSTGTATHNAGLGITWDFEDAGGAEEQASLDVQLTTATNGSEDVAIIFSQQGAGTVQETLRIQGADAADAADYLQFTGNTSETNGIVDILKLLVDTSETVANNIGAGISVQIEDAGGVEEQASLDFQVTDTTTNSENCDYLLNLNTEGTMRNVFGIDTDATATDNTLFTLTSWTIETDGVRDMLELVLDNTADTATDNFGLGISISMEDEDDAAEQQASLDFVLTDAGSGVEDCDIIFSQNVAGTITERVRMDADGANLLLSGATPSITIGDAGEEDTKIVFDGNAQDYHIGLDDAGGSEADLFTIGKGSALGTTPALTVDSDLNVVVTTSLKTPVETLVATETLTANESMKLLVLSHATEFATTLPPVASSAGITYHIVIGAAPSGASYTVVTDSGENKIYGVAVVNGDSVQASAEDTITFTDGAADVGDWVELTSDGTNWYVSGQGHAATAIVFTAT